MNKDHVFDSEQDQKVCITVVTKKPTTNIEPRSKEKQKLSTATDRQTSFFFRTFFCSKLAFMYLPSCAVRSGL
ncbi:unnamed protein product [Amoebophrya sp. A25]|nr:unnamed protein product [Amoebophrya sp. A25]|eukprot:GSA25T00010539001.1